MDEKKVNNIEAENNTKEKKPVEKVTKKASRKKAIEENKVSANDMSIIEEFMNILQQQGMKEQSQNFEELLQYIGNMQMQLESMSNELQGMREDLSQIQENQIKSNGEKASEKIHALQNGIKDLYEKVTVAKELLVNTVKQSVNTFKEKGMGEMNKVFQKGISKIKSVLSNCKEQMTDICTEYEKKANQIDSIGDELKQIGNSIANVGRLASGKGAKEITDERQGVGATRLINAPIKKKISILKNQMNEIDKVCKKLDAISEKLNDIENNKSERVSVKEKLSQMKEKVEQNTSQNPKLKTKENTL